MKYIAFFDTLEYTSERRSIDLSSCNVVEYMAEVMSRHGHVEIISPARSLNKHGYYKGRTTDINSRISLTVPPSWGVSSFVGRIFMVLFTRIWLFFYLLFSLKRHEKVIVYHSLSLMRVMTLLKRIKKIELILEIREIYTDINTTTDKEKRREHKFFKEGDKYIFPTKLLNNLINKDNKPYIIAAGIYRSGIVSQKKWDDDKIHVLYAGTFRKKKGGVDMALELAQYLDDRYWVHILGKGDLEEEIAQKAKEYNETSEATITYDGCLRGDDFLSFIQKCDIGLSTQIPQGEYNNSSFPSKVLTYLSNGLDVLSIDIPAVRESVVGDIVNYYSANRTPQEIAQILMSITTGKKEEKYLRIYKLDKKLENDLLNFISYDR